MTSPAEGKGVGRNVRAMACPWRGGGVAEKSRVMFRDGLLPAVRWLFLCSLLSFSRSVQIPRRWTGA